MPIQRRLDYTQKDDFLKYVYWEILPLSALEDSIYWISKNLKPEDVFEKDALEKWAEENGFTKE